MTQMRDGVKAIKEAVDIQVAASLGMLSQEQVDDLVDMGVHRYNHNLEAGALLLPAGGHHALLGGALGHLPDGQGRPAWSCAAAALVGMGETVEQRAELAAQLGDARARTRCR